MGSFIIKYLRMPSVQKGSYRVARFSLFPWKIRRSNLYLIALSCIYMGFVHNRPLHVVCAPKDDYLAIITAYLPSDQEWESDYQKRKKK